MNRQRGPKVFALPNIVAYVEATPVILSLSPL